MAGAFTLVPLTTADPTRTAELVRGDAEYPLGAVVAIAERLHLREVIPLDRRHFSVIGPRHIPGFTLLPD